MIPSSDTVAAISASSSVPILLCTCAEKFTLSYMSSGSSGVSGLSRPSTTFVTLPSGLATIENTLNESVWNVNVLPTASAVKISSPLSYTVYLAPGVILLSVTVNHTG